MKLEMLFHQLLGLGEEWEVAGLAVREADGVVEIRIRETAKVWSAQRCEADGAALSGYDHGAERRWRHLNIFQYRCEIVCALPRGRCPTCGKVSTVKAPWEGLTKHFTLAFEAMCLLLLRDLPVAALARFVGETDTRLWRLLQRHVETAREGKDMSQVEHVCCDEVAVRKGHQYATVFADCQRRDVLFVTPHRDDLTWYRFREDFSAHGGDLSGVRTATMDMSASYQSGARHFAPQATLVFDHFHVIRLANDALDEVRRLEVRASDQAVAGLKRTRFLWLSNREDLSDDAKAKVEGLERSFVATANAYRIKLALQDIYRITESLRAHRRLQAWLRWVPRLARKDPLLKPVRRLCKTITKHLVGILAFFDHRLTNGYMEGLMSVFSATKRKARGYRSLRNLSAMLYLVGSHLNLPSQNLAGGPISSPA